MNKKNLLNKWLDKKILTGIENLKEIVESIGLSKNKSEKVYEWKILI